MRGICCANMGLVCVSLLAFTLGVHAYSTLTVVEARQMAESGEAVFVDVRQRQYYEEGHIPGAILLPLESIEATVRSGQVPVRMSDALILYCDCPAEESSIMASSILEHYGFVSVHVLKGGWQAWKDAGYPVVAGPEPGTLKQSPTPSPPPGSTLLPPTTVLPLQPPSEGGEYVTPFIIAMLLLLAACAVILVLFYAFFIKGK